MAPENDTRRADGFDPPGDDSVGEDPLDAHGPVEPATRNRQGTWPTNTPGHPLPALGRFLVESFGVLWASVILFLVITAGAALVAKPLDLLPGPSLVGKDWVQVWSFEQIRPCEGDPDGLVAAVEDAGITARWVFDLRRDSGRTAVERGERYFDEPLGSFSAFATIFRDHGYALERENRLQPDYRSGLRSGFVPSLLLNWWYSTMYPAALALIAWRLRRTLRRDGRVAPVRISHPAAGAAGLVLGAPLAVFNAPESSALGLPEPPPNSPYDGLSSLTAGGDFGFVLAVLAGVVVLPLAQEVLCRGWAFPYLEHNAGRITAYFGSMGLQAVLFFPSERLLPALVTGLVLAWAYDRWRSLLVPVLALSTMNGVLLTLLKVRTPPF